MSQRTEEKKLHKLGAIPTRRQRNRYLGGEGWSAAARVGASRALTLVLDGYGFQCNFSNCNMDKDMGDNVQQNRKVVVEVAFPHCPASRLTMHCPATRLTIPRHYRYR